jgi:hypothetical protein
MEYDWATGITEGGEGDQYTSGGGFAKEYARRRRRKSIEEEDEETQPASKTPRLDAFKARQGMRLGSRTPSLDAFKEKRGERIGSSTPSLDAYKKKLADREKEKAVAKSPRVFSSPSRNQSGSTV